MSLLYSTIKSQATRFHLLMLAAKVCWVIQTPALSGPEVGLLAAGLLAAGLLVCGAGCQGSSDRSPGIIIGYRE